MINILGLCDSVAVLEVVSLIKLVVNIIMVAAPIILIIAASLTMFKGVYSEDKDALTKGLGSIARKFIAVAIIFYIPSAINMLIGLTGNTEFFEGYNQCFNTSRKEIVYMKKSGEAACNELIANNEEKNVQYIWNKQTYLCDKIVTTKIGVENLVVYRQSNYRHIPFCYNNSTVANSGCGAAAFASITSAMVDEKYDVEYVANWLCKYGNVHSGGTVTSHFTNPDLLNHFGLEQEVLFNRDDNIASFQQDKANLIWKALDDGAAVMLGVPNHWVTVGPNEKCPDGQYFLYDSGFSGRRKCYNQKDLWQDTYNSGLHCSRSGDCGWDVALAFWPED